MKEELLHFYPSVKGKNVSIVGTPQFEPYIMAEYYMKKTNFFSKFNLAKNKKTVCFSCGDTSVGANDELYIKTIVEAMRSGAISEEINLLVRTSPADDGSRFEGLKNACPEILWNIPKWELTRYNHVEPWSQRLPSFEDLNDLKAILTHTDISVNMCSTMSLDFMVFDKPVINPVFGNEKNELFDDQRFLKYTHYKRVVDSKAVAIAKNEKELILKLNEALAAPEESQKERACLMSIQIGEPLQNTSSKVIESLLCFVESTS